MFSTCLIDGPDAPGVGVAFTDREGGVSAAPFDSLNLGRTDVDPAVPGNFAALRERCGLGAIVVAHQVHGTAVLDVDADFLADWDERSPYGPAAGRPELRQADALVSRAVCDPPVALCIRVADCVPVLLADPAARVIGAAHAGREGFAAGVLDATVATMRARGAQRLQAWIGPHICGSCYEVPATMRDAVGEGHPAARATTSWGTPALDLGAGCAARLEALGVQVTRCDPCTREDPALYSHRRDGGAAGRLGALIWLLP